MNSEAGFGKRTVVPLVRRRYNPITEGFSSELPGGIPLGITIPFRNVESEAWRWLGRV